MENEIEKADSQLPVEEKQFTEDEISKIAAEVGPSDVLKDSLTEFVRDVCNQVREEDKYISELKQVALQEAKAGHLKNNELIALLTSATSNKNDLTSKVINPTMSLLQAAQQNAMNERKELLREREKSAAPKSDIRSISEIAPSDVLVGLQALFTQATIATRSKQQHIDSEERQ